jgi:signal transduction histidine kinase
MLVSRQQIWLTVAAGIFLVAAVAIFAAFAFSPTAAVVYGPILLTAFVVALFIGMVCILLLLRGLLRPYNELVGEAKRAPVVHSGKTQNEAAFVLETFQSVVAQLQEQQKELERLSAQATERAHSAERFSERIVASMPTGLIAFDASGHATVMNAPARALFADRPSNSKDHFRSIFSSLPALADMVATCLTEGRVYRREEIEAANGSAPPMRVGATVAPIDPSESGARGVLCLLTDITEVTRLREQVALKRNLESLGEMSAGLAHEFKNAMAALHGYAQFLQSVDHDERGRAAANALVQEVRNLSEMITAFLNFARPQQLQLEDISLDELIQECEQELKPLFARCSIDLVIAGSFSAPPLHSLRLGGESAAATSHHRDAENTKAMQRVEVRADPRLLRQALINLIRNAAEAISDDRHIRRVTVRTSTEEDQHERRWAIVAIQDTGPGIPAADLQKIFIPFFTTKATGHGVGLALAHRVISEHGGTLTAANAPDGGAVFMVRLPM